MPVKKNPPDPLAQLRRCWRSSAVSMEEKIACAHEVHKRISRQVARKGALSLLNDFCVELEAALLHGGHLNAKALYEQLAFLHSVVQLSAAHHKKWERPSWRYAAFETAMATIAANGRKLPALGLIGFSLEREDDNGVLKKNVVDRTFIARYVVDLPIEKAIPATLPHAAQVG